jgi:predicted amidohydrolase
MPVTLNNSRYNCRIWCYNGQVLGIRPKIILANDGNYRETRWFSAWTKGHLAQHCGGAPVGSGHAAATEVLADSYLGGSHPTVALGADMVWFPLPPLIQKATCTPPTTHPCFYPGSKACRAHADRINPTVEDATEPFVPLPSPDRLQPSPRAAAARDTATLSDSAAASAAAHPHPRAPQRVCPMGVFMVRAGPRAVTLASEVCEELYCAAPAHLQLYLAGADVVSNASGSHHNLRKLGVRLALMRSASSRGLGVYMYANQQGCDGGRLYFDGCATVFDSGDLLCQGNQFSLNDVEVVCATVDISRNRANRGLLSSRAVLAASAGPIGVVAAPGLHLGLSADEYRRDARTPGPAWPALVTPHRAPAPGPQYTLNRPVTPRELRPEEEIGYGPACWLWDYLRRARLAGFLLPLSGGADSSASAAIVGIMCQVVSRACAQGNAAVQADVRRLLGEVDAWPSARELCGRIFFTVYMGSGEFFLVACMSFFFVFN